MKRIIVQPSPALNGAIRIPGSKNSTLALIAAACLADEPVRLCDIPSIADIQIIEQIGEGMGVIIRREEAGQLLIDVRGIQAAVIEPAKASAFRTAYYFIGALLAKHGRVSVGYPGGDDFVSRPIDQHVKALTAMGARFTFHADHYVVEAASLEGADIYFDMITSGATMNVMMAASRAKGRTVLRNAARDPEVVDTANLLIQMGARIRGAGTDTIVIDGVSHLSGCTYHVIPDRLIAGAFLMAAGVTGGSVTVTDVIPEHLGSCLAKLTEIGLHMESTSSTITAHATGVYRATRVRTAMYPGFATDLQQPLTSLLLKAQGRSLISDRVYPNRFQHAAQLSRMGADIEVRSGVARLNGGKPLTGTLVHASDIRAGISLIMAGMIAEGRTTIMGVHHIERGYENMIEDFRVLGAKIAVCQSDDEELHWLMSNAT
jgi:UDP-N-acetylglucosamine 1-carboxyvinyltransferase